MTSIGLSERSRAISRAAVALEVAPGLALLLPYRSPRALAVALVVAVAIRAWRAARAPDDGLTWPARIAGAMGCVLAGVVGGWIADLAPDASHLTSVAAQSLLWLSMPTIVASLLLLTQPRVGLAAIALWAPIFAVVGHVLVGVGTPSAEWGPVLRPDTRLGLIPTLALLLTLALAVRERRWRIPLTWALAGLGLALACSAIGVDLRYARQAALVRVPTTDVHTSIDLLVAGAMLIGSRNALQSRTWGVLLLVGACLVLGTLAPPHLAYATSCAGSGPIHPLDADHGRLAWAIAALLALTWCRPIARWLAAPH